MWFIYIMYALFAFILGGTILGLVRTFSSDNQ